MEQVSRPGVYKAKLMVEFQPRVKLLGGSLKPQHAGTQLVTVTGSNMVSCAKEPEISKQVMCETLNGTYNESTKECTALNHVSCGYVREARKIVDHNVRYQVTSDSSSQICYLSKICDSGKIYLQSKTCYRHCGRQKHGEVRSGSCSDSKCQDGRLIEINQISCD